MEETVKDRLLKYVHYKGLSSSDFCRSIGVSVSYISSIRTSIQPDKLTSIAENYEDLNIGWLLTGVGKMQNEVKNDENLIALVKSKESEMISIKDEINLLKEHLSTQKELIKILKEKVKFLEGR